MIINSVSKLVEDKTLPKVAPVASIKEACDAMTNRDARALVVLDDNELVGVISERDVVRNCIAKGLDVTKTRVEAIMTTGVKTIATNDSIAMAIDIMQQGKFHHVPVMDDDRVLGLISSDDIPDEYRMLLERFKEMRNP